ncbi:tetratricopeptide repeat protein [Pleomorphomonas sp. JP5]|uniref:tetratricopeptide repeat protein n=1 Tax=Pleomorphomonas sp. JP5 TaxID=2942998 RepID=UPI002044C119|nr:tetratricopeptide repeat protein [Pleomorphomonas sp. JP5]MCM5558014.1 tetratricopeptide repeat protein [Pleomorphomonas sp. JP5]
MTETVIDQLLARAAAAEEAHKWIEAVALYEVALVRSPDHVPAMLGAAAAARANGDHARAVVFLTRADRTAPGRADISSALGEALTATSRLPEAAVAFERARAAKPLDAGLAARLGAARLAAGDAAGAVSAFEAALRLDPAEPRALGGLGSALAAAGRPLAAIEAFRRVGEPRPRADRAAALLALGDMAGGFADLDALAGRPVWATRLQAWDGFPLDRPLLVWAGSDPLDLAAFAPALPLARSLVADLVLVVPKPFVRLASALAGVSRVVADNGDIGEVIDEAGAAASLVGLPHRLGLTAGSFASTGPLLAVEPMLADRWSARLDLGRGRPAVGLVWGSGIGLADFTPLAGIGDLRFIALERLPSAMLARSSSPSGWEVAGASVRIEHPGPDFEAGIDARVDCASLISRLDAVIAIEGMPLRLAGLLGRPGVALLPAVANWIWRIEGSKTPVYPSLSLLRQVPEGALAALLPEAIQRVRGMVRG